MVIYYLSALPYYSVARDADYIITFSLEMVRRATWEGGWVGVGEWDRSRLPGFNQLQKC